MLLIYTTNLTNRIRYIFDLYFGNLVRTDYRLTTDPAEFLSFAGMKMSYAVKPIGDELFFASTHLLFERGIAHHDPRFIEHNGTPGFFGVYHKDSALPFDPFAAAFYLVTRYEEYLPYMKDRYGRFPAKESLACKNGFLDRPLVNTWALTVAGLIAERYPGFSPLPRKFRFILTIDIDAAYAYRCKGIFRSAGGFLNSLRASDFRTMADRFRVLAGLQKDPFDTYDFQFDIQEKYDLRPIYFILFADYGQNDKNIPVQSRKFRNLIKLLADHAEVGIHPSFGSNSNLRNLKTEIEGLSGVLNREITKSRQHFLKLNLPETYRNLINHGITDDYSMGFAAEPGFRAGISDSFRFYDLDTDAETQLRVHPFAVMDGTLRDYKNVEAGEAMSHILPLLNRVRQVNGTFIILWHNESLSDTGRWTGWRRVYEEVIREALSPATSAT